MENKAEWHGKAPNNEEYKMAISELEKINFNNLKNNQWYNKKRYN